jgi:hypothetical protein
MIVYGSDSGGGGGDDTIQTVLSISLKGVICGDYTIKLNRRTSPLIKKAYELLLWVQIGDQDTP